jgi:hypothetical protein
MSDEANSDDLNLRCIENNLTVTSFCVDKFCIVEEIVTGHTINICIVTECYVAVQFRFCLLIMYSLVLRPYICITLPLLIKI